MPFQIHLIIGGICSRDVHDSLAESHDTRVHGSVARPTCAPCESYTSCALPGR